MIASTDPINLIEGILGWGSMLIYIVGATIAFVLDRISKACAKDDKTNEIYKPYMKNIFKWAICCSHMMISSIIVLSVALLMDVLNDIIGYDHIVLGTFYSLGLLVFILGVTLPAHSKRYGELREAIGSEQRKDL